VQGVLQELLETRKADIFQIQATHRRVLLPDQVAVWARLFPCSRISWAPLSGKSGPTPSTENGLSGTKSVKGEI